MSPIYVRPEREQAEHDRLIRFLQTTYSQQFEVGANPGDERTAPVKIAANTHFPDLVLNDGKRLAGLVEVETAASVNNLETMAKWVPFSRARVAFHLYVPVPGYEAAMRLAEAHNVKATEIWTYRPANEGFDLVRMFVDSAAVARREAASNAAKAKPAARKPAPAPAPAAAKPAPVKSAPAKTAKTPPAKKAAPAASKSKPAPRVASRKAAPVKNAKTAKPKASSKTAKGSTAKKGTGARKKR